MLKSNIRLKVLRPKRMQVTDRNVRKRSRLRVLRESGNILQAMMKTLKNLTVTKRWYRSLEGQSVRKIQSCLRTLMNLYAICARKGLNLIDSIMPRSIIKSSITNRLISSVRYATNDVTRPGTLSAIWRSMKIRTSTDARFVASRTISKWHWPNICASIDRSWRKSCPFDVVCVRVDSQRNRSATGTSWTTIESRRRKRLG
uniref:(northern house mosquito) hypothetical protein n=1 Tax=Culex pipiens TaxID=7175 RepID=A0A8D8K6H8_CULPI